MPKKKVFYQNFQISVFSQKESVLFKFSAVVGTLAKKHRSSWDTLIPTCLFYD